MITAAFCFLFVGSISFGVLTGLIVYLIYGDKKESIKDAMIKLNKLHHVPYRKDKVMYCRDCGEILAYIEKKVIIVTKIGERCCNAE